MLNFIQATVMAAKNHSRISRILREIDAPRNQAVKEARLSARQYQDMVTREYSAALDRSMLEPWEGFDR